LVLKPGKLTAQETEQLPLVLRRELAPDARPPKGQPVRWLDLRGTEIPSSATVPPGGIRLQAVFAGRYILPLRTGPHSVVALGVSAQSHEGSLRKRAAPSRTLPRSLDASHGPHENEELQRFVVIGPAQELPSSGVILSVNAHVGDVDSVGLASVTS